MWIGIFLKIEICEGGSSFMWVNTVIPKMGMMMIICHAVVILVYKLAFQYKGGSEFRPSPLLLNVMAEWLPLLFHI
jgi:hypothetical protein